MLEQVEPLVLRPAGPGDEETLFHWRNLDWVVALGASGQTVTRSQHKRWFAETVEGTQRLLFLVEAGGRPTGMIRFDLGDEAEAEVSIYVMPEHVGRGIGAWAFNRALPMVVAQQPVRRLTARVRVENERSLAFFLRLGFVTVEPEERLHRLVRRMDTVPHSRPWVGKEEAEAAAAVVRSRHMSQGPEVAALEREWCAWTETASAAAVGSGLGALRLALKAVGVRDGDQVIVPAYSCVALPNAVLALGARPVPADVRRDGWTLDPDDVERRCNDRTRAVIITHMFGAPADLPAVGVPVIEDCAHGIGGDAGGKPFGGAADVSIASFYSTKMIGAGEGGIVASGDNTIIQKVRQARDYGDQAPAAHHLNDKMSDIEAAVARVQLGRLEQILERRRALADRYTERLGGAAARHGIRLPSRAKRGVWYRYVVSLDTPDAHKVCEGAHRLGVAIEQPVWDLRATPFWGNGLENTAHAFDHVVSLPLYPDLEPWEQDRVIATFEHLLREAEVAR